MVSPVASLSTTAGHDYYARHGIKAHNLGDPNGRGYRLTADIRLDTEGPYGMVLLGNQYGNGFVVLYEITSAGGDRTLQVFENYGGTADLTASASGNYTLSLLGDTVFTTLAIGEPHPFYTLNMDLHQDGAGQPFTITAWVDEEVEARFDIFDHRVRYEGQLDADGRGIRGSWLIAGQEAGADHAGTPDASGAFVLFRQ